MSTPVRILCFAGTLRTGSFNKQFARLAAKLVTEAGGEGTFVDLRDYALPVYDGDIETQGGLPDAARKLKALFMDHQGVVVSCGEYNGSITGALKNAFDWVSRREGSEPSKAAFHGKVGLLLSTATGQHGGMRAMPHVRTILGNLGVMMLPAQLALPRAQEAFAADGTLKDAAMQATLAGHIKRLVRVTQALLEA